MKLFIKLVDFSIIRIKQVLRNPSLANTLGQAGIEKVKEEHNPRKAGIVFNDFIQQFIYEKN